MLFDHPNDVVVDIRIWKGKDGRAVAALDPQNHDSHQFMIEGRDLFKAILAGKHDLKDFVMYESQGNGMYTPSKPTDMLHHGASIREAELVGFGERLEAQAWKHSQKLAEHKLPPPTPHTEWPIDR